MQAIMCATKTNAELLGIEQTTGTLTVGKQADLIVLNGNPLDDIRNTREDRRRLARGQGSAAGGGGEVNEGRVHLGLIPGLKVSPSEAAYISTSCNSGFGGGMVCSASTMASANSLVPAVPPTSRVRCFFSV